MRRRQFLQAMAALGVGSVLPSVALANAPAAIIDAAWIAAQREPLTFYVSSWGTISFGANEDWQQCRRQLFGLEPARTPADLVSLADQHWRLGAVLDQAWVDWSDDDLPPRDPDEGVWRDGLATATTAQLEHLIDVANEWLEDPADEYDWEVATLRGDTEQGAALGFFRGEAELNALFNIEIVEGAHPGSSYYAAELRMPVDEANALAAAEGLPLRFIATGD